MRISVSNTHGALLAAALLFSPLAAAQTNYIWTGAVSADWNTAGNWNPAGVPGHDSDTAVFGLATSSHVNVTIADTVDPGTLSFLHLGSEYTFHVTGGTSYIDNFDNPSSSSQHFVIDTAAFLGISGGSADGASFDNSGEFIISESGSAGSAQITARSGSQNYLTQAASADNARVTTEAGSLFDISIANSGISVGSLSGEANVFLGSKLLTLGQLNLDDNLAGPIADGGYAGGSGGALTKVGSGTLMLSGANTYTGPTTIQSGTLHVEGSLASSDVIVVVGATLAGAGTVGDVSAQPSSSIIPGNANPNTTLTTGTLHCSATPNVLERIGNLGSSTHGTYLTLTGAAPLKTELCPQLHFKFTSAGVPLVAGEGYLLALIDGFTDYAAADMSYDFLAFPGYLEAQGHFLVSPLGSISTIFFIVDDVGDLIFRNGFELIN